jgi:chromosome partitioning protein
VTAPLLVFASGKGGTGKTTLALALAQSWSETGLRVALVDADPQAGLTTAAGLSPVADPLTAPPSAVHGVTLYRSGRTLAYASEAEHRARLEAAQADADLVLVDCSPALTDNAHLAAVRLAALVVVCARTDAAGLRNVAETVLLADERGAPVAVVPTFRGATALSREAEAFLLGRYAERLTQTAIPNDARAADAPGAGVPVTLHAKRSKAAQAVHALRVELTARLSLPVPAL